MHAVKKQFSDEDGKFLWKILESISGTVSFIQKNHSRYKVK